MLEILHPGAESYVSGPCATAEVLSLEPMHLPRGCDMQGFVRLMQCNAVLISQQGRHNRSNVLHSIHVRRSLVEGCQTPFHSQAFWTIGP